MQHTLEDWPVTDEKVHITCTLEYPSNGRQIPKLYLLSILIVYRKVICQEPSPIYKNKVQLTKAIWGPEISRTC